MTNTIVERKCSGCKKVIPADWSGQIFCSLMCQILKDPIDDSRIIQKNKQKM